MSKRKICIVTGTRAEYGLLKGLMSEIKKDAQLELQVAVTGMHLSHEFGLTYQAIEADGFAIDEKVEMLLSSDTAVAITKSMGLGVIGFAEAFKRLQPDVVVILGDRFEVFAAAQAAMMARIPIAHIHGGESTEGAIDESIRHSITKMAQIHFVSAETYRKRVIQLGENPKFVYNVGAPGIDNILNAKLLSKSELEKQLMFKFGKSNFLITYHPATLGEIKPSQSVKELFKALDEFPDAQIIFTRSNADAAGREINDAIDGYVSKNNKRAHVFTSLGQERYLSTLSHADVVIGNSSSGIIEAPALKVPTVNIGPRQKGRIKAESVIDCEESAKSIAVAIKKSTSSAFKKSISTMKPLFGKGTANSEMKKILKSVNLDNILMKKFFDLE